MFYLNHWCYKRLFTLLAVVLLPLLISGCGLFARSSFKVIGAHNLSSVSEAYQIATNKVAFFNLSKLEYEIFDIEEQAALKRGKLDLDYTKPVSTKLDDSNILFTGGTTTSRPCDEDSCRELKGWGVKDVCILNVTNMKCKKVMDMKNGRKRHAVSTLTKNKLLITGGAYSLGYPNYTILDTSEVIDLERKISTTADKLSGKRDGHKSLNLDGDKVLIFSGKTKKNTPFSEVFNKKTNKFTPFIIPSQLPKTKKIFKHSDNLLVFFGKGEAYLYDIFRKNVTGPFEMLKNTRKGYGVCQLTDGTFLVTGGRDDRMWVLKEAEIFLPEQQKFIPAGNMNYRRLSPMSLALDNGKALIFGGEIMNADNNIIEVYEP